MFETLLDIFLKILFPVYVVAIYLSVIAIPICFLGIVYEILTGKTGKSYKHRILDGEV